METGGNSISCSHPNSSECVDFKVEQLNTRQSLNGHFYDLFCDSRYIVHKHNLERNHVLTHKKYEITLKQWLVENSNNWCTRWGVNRPTENARQIIQGILNAVHKLHKNRSFHGFLDNLENFAMDSDELVIGGYHKEIKHISLIHANVEGGRSVRLPGDGNLLERLEVGKKNDIQAMSNVIFNEILQGEPDTSYPPDLKHLYCLLQNSNWIDTDELGHIVNHPSLWHWKSRVSYIVSVSMYYQHADPSTRLQMTGNFNLINVEGWKQRIPPNNPHRKIFQNKRYGNSAYELLRYLRNAHVHYKEKKRDLAGNVLEGEYAYIDWRTEGDYLNEEFFELKTTEIGGQFLVDLYYMMRLLRLEI